MYLQPATEYFELAGKKLVDFHSYPILIDKSAVTRKLVAPRGSVVFDGRF